MGFYLSFVNLLRILTITDPYFAETKKSFRESCYDRIRVPAWQRSRWHPAGYYIRVLIILSFIYQNMIKYIFDKKEDNHVKRNISRVFQTKNKKPK